MQNGDGLNGQPGESDVTLSTLAEEMDAGDEGEGSLDESEDEESEETEQVEGEEEQEGDGEPDESVKTKYTIKHDGKVVELELTKAEHDAMLQQSFDYTQKTMAVADDRKAVQAERATVSERRQQYEQTLTETANRLHAYTQFIEAQVGQPPDTAMLSYDTNGYLIAKEHYEARKGQLQQAYAETQQLQHEQARHRQAWISEKAAATERALHDTQPGWNDDMLHALAEYAGKLGLTPQSAEAAMLEPGFWQLAHKAKAYDALVAEKTKLKPVAQLAKVAKPSASNQPNRASQNKADAFKRLKENPGSLNALAALVG